MQLGTLDDVRTTRRLLGDDAFGEALRHAPPGILDARSWNFWHLVLFRAAPGPRPERPLAPKAVAFFEGGDLAQLAPAVRERLVAEATGDLDIAPVSRRSACLD